MSKKVLLPCLALCLLVIGLACDSASPVAPTGTLLSISASPNEITANGTSTIRVTALRANGTPVNPGTIVRLDTTIGTIAEQVETDEQGEARATLRGNGDIGTATVTARSGSAESATVEVTVGDVASSVSLQATPSQIPEEGDEITLLAVVRDSDGEPLEDATVNFGTEVGRLESGGSIIRSNSLGEAEDTLIVSATDLQPISANSFNVSVTVGAADATRNESAAIRINRCVTAAFTATPLPDNRLQVVNQSSGQGTLTYFWDFDDGATPPTSTERDPSEIDYGSDGGQKTISLTVSANCGDETERIPVFIEADP